MALPFLIYVIVAALLFSVGLIGLRFMIGMVSLPVLVLGLAYIPRAARNVRSRTTFATQRLVWEELLGTVIAVVLASLAIWMALTGFLLE
jgi:hypothetical protein